MAHKHTQKTLQSYVPSERLVKKTHDLIERFPHDDIQRRLRNLSRNMNRDGEWKEEHAASPMSHMAVEGVEIETAAGDLINIGEMIRDISQGKTLERQLVDENSNTHLQLFDAYHPRLPTRIQKCLSATAEWCTQQMDELDHRATEMSKQAKGCTPEEARQLGTKIQYLDATMGMLYSIQQWAELATKEIKLAKKKASHSNDKGVA